MKLTGFILRNRVVVEVPLLEAAIWWEKRSNRRIARYEKNGVTVSTVFLFCDHNFSGVGLPILFETMIFGGEFDEEQFRYSSYDEAISKHLELVRRVKASQPEAKHYRETT